MFHNWKSRPKAGFSVLKTSRFFKSTVHIVAEYLPRTENEPLVECQGQLGKLQDIAIVGVPYLLEARLLHRALGA
jgi:hypothetical protein